ncbi:MAG: Rsd/AlgQ family anti-sigma factor [Pseudomonadota bacterium]
MQTQTDQQARGTRENNPQPPYIGPEIRGHQLTSPGQYAGQEERSCKEIRRARSSLLSYVLKLKKSIDAGHTDLAQAITQRFIQSLTDYLSYSHFRLLNSYDAQAHQIVALQNNTDVLLGFSDHYAQKTRLNLQLLQTDLEQLALALEVRFEVEDEIVARQIWQ